MIGIIVAMDSEWNAIVEIMDQVENIRISGIAMAKGKLNNKKIIVMKSGVGKGNAAMSMTILFENFMINKVINIGTAGGLKPEQQVLDAVVSTQVVQHDYDTSPIDGKEGIGLYYSADQELIDKTGQILKSMDVRVFKGLIASGDQFIAEDDKRNRLEQLFPDAICAEMEAGAIGQVCAHYHVPFVVLRSLSDVACNKDSHLDFATYVVHAAKRSAILCKELMNVL